jgi:uncharacterized protein DUF5994
MTSFESVPPPATRVPLRLRLADPDRPQALDGGWWPQSTNLAVEMGDLVDGFPPEQARIVRAVYSPPDWEDAPKRVTTARGYIETAAFAREFSPVMILTTSDRRKLCLLVIPARLTQSQGEAALEASVTPRFAPSPAELLATITAGTSA